MSNEYNIKNVEIINKTSKSINGIINPNFIFSDIELTKSENVENLNKILPKCEEQLRIKDEILTNRNIIRNLAAYYLLGLCNNFGFFVMLSAANDIMDEFDDQEKKLISDTNVTISDGHVRRSCHLLSTGTILLADVLPGLIVKCIVPFLPFYIHIQILSSILMAAIGYSLVGFSITEFYTILGIIFVSASTCLGESSFLSYSTNYNKYVVAAWSAGGAGIAGSISYAALRELNIPKRKIISFMLILPIIEYLVFRLLLPNPANNTNVHDNNVNPKNNFDEKPLITFLDKCFYFTCLLKYMFPLMTIYFAQYFINQGLYQLVYFENIFLDKAAQYRWFIVDYQIGVFIARATVALFSIKRVWIMSILQIINVIYFLIESIYYITPNIWIIFVIVFWEGLLGGGGYANTFYKVSQEIPNDRKSIAMAIVSTSDTIGIGIAGFASIYIYNFICSLPAPIRL